MGLTGAPLGLLVGLASATRGPNGTCQEIPMRWVAFFLCRVPFGLLLAPPCGPSLGPLSPSLRRPGVSGAGSRVRREGPNQNLPRGLSMVGSDEGLFGSQPHPSGPSCSIWWRGGGGRNAHGSCVCYKCISGLQAAMEPSWDIAVCTPGAICVLP